MRDENTCKKCGKVSDNLVEGWTKDEDSFCKICWNFMMKIEFKEIERKFNRKFYSVIK